MEKSRTQILGENLDRIRKEKGYSRKQLAEVLGVTDKTIGNYINGEKEPSFKKLFALADFLKVSVASLTGENNFSNNLPNIEKLIKDKIFEFRYHQAFSLAKAANYSLIELDGAIFITVTVNRKIKDDDGNFKVSEVTSQFKFENKYAFINAMEKAVTLAACGDFTFQDAFNLSFSQPL